MKKMLWLGVVCVGLIAGALACEALRCSDEFHCDVRYHREIETVLGDGDSVKIYCTDCDGRGVAFDRTCNRCGGRGWLRMSRADFEKARAFGFRLRLYHQQ